MYAVCCGLGGELIVVESSALSATLSLRTASSWRARSSDVLVGVMVFVYWLTYENVIFFYPKEFGGVDFVVVATLIKLALPLVLLMYAGLPSFTLLTRGASAVYWLLFVAFLLWALVPTLVSGDPLSWLKLAPRAVFFLAAVSLFAARPAVFVVFAKILSIYLLAALAQYLVLYVSGAWVHTTSIGAVRMAGPFGLLGNIGGMFDIPGLPMPFLRLTGFWSEPSNASGGAFAACFLSLFLAETGQGRHWKVAATLCGITGFLAFSNAGYLAFGAAVLAGLLLEAGRWRASRVARFVLLLAIAIGLAVVAVKGRRYVFENMPENAWARAFTGLRTNEGESLDDATAGRVDLFRLAAREAGTNIIGRGVQTVGSEGINDVSASAPVFWLALTGVPGLVLLLLRELVLLTEARRLVSFWPSARPLVQALVAVLVQQASYGSWMNPNYLVVAAAILVFASPTGRGMIGEFSRARSVVS